MKSSFFLHQPIESSNVSNFRDFLKPDDEKRIEIMNLVKEGLPLEEALSKAQEMGIAVNNTSFQLKFNDVYNFGIYKYQRNNKCTKCILQLDFQENVLYLIKRGLKQKSYQFDSIEYIDTEDNLTRIVIHFENGLYIDIEPGSLEEKSRISRLLLFILNQDQQEPPRLNSLVANREKILLEGLLEKRGRKAPFTTWTKRFVKILPGEVMYFKVGNQENESSALSIIPLKLGDSVLKVNDGEFTLLLNDKEYSFRIIPSKNSNSTDRDNWIQAIENAIKTSSIHKNESFSNAHDQRQIFSNAFKSIKAQLKQFESILHSIEAPYEAWEQLKKIQKTVSFLREKIKQKNYFDEKIIVNNHNNKDNIKKKEIDSPCSTSNLNFNQAVDQSLNLQTGLLSNIPTIQTLSVSNAQTLNIPIVPQFSIPTPPLLSGLSSKLPAKPTVVPTCKMKPLFWTKTNDTDVLKSFWMNSQDKTHLLNLKKLENLFYHVGQEIAKKEPKKVSELDCKNSQNMTLLDQRKAQNLGIFLSGFKINETNIEEKLMMFNTSEGLTNEEIVALKKFHPTADEVEMYKNYQGDNKKLTDIDKFMIKLCNIPNLAVQLNLLLTMHDLPDEIKNIKMLLKHLMNACLCLLENNNFTRLLEYILVLGNYMNGGTPRGAAYGFKLSVLTKLIDIKSFDKKYTLIDFIVDELWEIDKEAICCYKDMQPLTNPIDFSLKNLLVEFQIMQKELLFFKEKHKGIETNLGEKICKNINEFYETYSKKILKVELMCQKIQDMCTLLKIKFGEQPSLPIETWLSEIGDFVKHLQTAVEVAERKHSKDCSSLATTISDSNKVNKISYTKNQNNENTETRVHTKIELSKSHALNLSNTPDKIIENISPVRNIVPIRELSRNADENKNTQCVISELKNVLLQNENKSNIDPTVKPQSLHQNSDPTVKPQSLHQNTEKFEQLKEKSGFLEKLSGGKKRIAKWDQRYFELKENGYLQYFKKKGGAIKGSVDLNGCPISLDPDNNCIIIVLQNNRQWKFKGDNNVIVAEWLNAFLYHASKD
ncbi:formin-J isoform X1 [Hydra vulgaris]|uniref:formin-J isoform X1 n=1 Tax=Hydra vulgaris TaxID=6087 RepID=UPI001F5FD5C3|nr:formin-J-like isoform X1 [Hydra vulgaris]